MKLFASPTPRQLDSGLAILRVITGLIFVAHGAQKLFTFGIAGVEAGFAQAGIPLAGLAAPLVATTELLGGLALIAGLLTRPFAAALGLIMIGAISFVHASAGFFLPDGYEFPLLLLAAAATMTLTGGGAYSLDSVLARRSAPRALTPDGPRVRRVA